MITSSIISNNLHVKSIGSIVLNRVAQVPPCAIMLWRPLKMVYSPFDCTYRDDISGSDMKRMHTIVSSIVQRLHLRLMPLLDNYHSSSLMYWPCCRCLNQGKELFNAQFIILDDEKTLQRWRNVSSSQLKVAIRTRPHSEKHCISSGWLILDDPCRPSAMSHMTCLLIALIQCHRKWYCVVLNAFRIIQPTAKLIVIEEIGTLVILLTHRALWFCSSPFGIAHHLAKSSRVLFLVAGFSLFSW